jgi:hypothetical protein
MESEPSDRERRVDRFAQSHQRRNHQIQIIVQIQTERLERVQHLFNQSKKQKKKNTHTISSCFINICFEIENRNSIP